MLAPTGDDEGARTTPLAAHDEVAARRLWAEWRVGSGLAEPNPPSSLVWRGGAAEFTDHALVVAVPNNFTRGWVEGHFLELDRARRS